MKLNIKKINKLLKENSCIAVRETLFDKKIYYSLIDQLRFEKIKVFVGNFNSRRVILFKRNIVDETTFCVYTGDNDGFFHDWKYFYDSKYSNHTYERYNTYYLIDYKNLFIGNEELE